MAATTPQPATRATRTVVETATILGISERTARARIYSGEIRTVRIGNRVLVPVSEIDRLLTPKTYKEGERHAD